MKITKMVRPLTILTHLTGSKYGQDFLCEISCLSYAYVRVESFEKIVMHQIESRLIGLLA